MKIFYSLYETVTGKDLLQKKSVEKIEKNECPFLKNNILSSNYYVLVGRHSVIDREASISVLHTKSTTTFSIEAGYIRCSEKFYNRTKVIESFFSYTLNFSIAILAMGGLMFVLSFFIDFGFSGNKLKGFLAYFIVFLVFFGLISIIWLILGNFIRSLYRAYVSKKMFEKSMV